MPDLASIRELVDVTAVLLVSTTVRSSIILAGAGLLAWMLGRSASARLHQIWCLALVASLSLPVLTAVSPRWHVHLPDPAGILLSRGGNALGPGLRTLEASRLKRELRARPYASITIATVWFAGLVLSIERQRRRQRRLRALVGRCSAVAIPRVSRIATEVAKEMGLRRTPRLLFASSGLMPMTWGTLRPVVVLPAAAAEAWQPTRLRRVLRHEFAHVSRGDAGVQFLAVGARTLLWFHPLIWLASNRLLEEQEHACDDEVLLAGEQPEAYALELVSLARDLRGLPVLAVAGMRSSLIRRRLLSVLDHSRRRRRMWRRQLAVSLGLAVALLTLGAAFSPAEELPQSCTTSSSTWVLHKHQTHEHRVSPDHGTATRHSSLPCRLSK